MSIKFRGKHKSGFWVPLPLEIIKFPAGEMHVQWSPLAGSSMEDFTEVLADVRGFSNDDFLALAMAAEFFCASSPSIRGALILPYLPAGRSDRGTPAGVEVYARILESMWWDVVVTLDPHSPRALYAYTFNQDYFRVFPVERIIRNEVQDVSSDVKAHPYAGVIAPDAGARGRAQAAATVMGVPMYQADKVRDFETGKLSGFRMVDDLPDEGRMLIVDDICDGGGTFIGLAEATGLPRERLDLWVTHGIFSKGFETLKRHFGRIRTTDSFYEPSVGSLGFVEVSRIAPYLYTDLGVG